MFGRSLPVFLCFKSSGLLRTVFVMVIRLLTDRCLGKVDQAYRSLSIRSAYSSLLVFHPSGIHSGVQVN